MPTEADRIDRAVRLARLEGEIPHIKEALEKLSDKMDENAKAASAERGAIRIHLASIDAMVNQVKGGWWLLAKAAAIVAALGSVAAWVFSNKWIIGIK